MATAKKLPSGQWRVLVYVGKKPDGKREYKSFTAPTKKEAEFMASDYLMNNATYKERDSRNTLKQAATAYIDARRNVLSPWTVNGYTRILNRDLGKLGNMRVSDITENMLQKFVNDYAATHSPKTVWNVSSFICSVIKKERPKTSFELNLPQKQRTKIVLPTAENIRQALEYTRDTEMWLVIALCAMLGLRRGEICALTWGDVKGGKVDISKAMATNEKNEQVLKAPKTDAGYRVLELPASIQEHLQKARNENTKDTDPLVTLTAQAVTKRWEAICKKLGFKCRFYDLRHYNASTMLALGIPDLYAMERMGHSTTHMLKTVYQHVQDEKRKETNRKVTEMMDKLGNMNPQNNEQV